jgi:perosamine synthetase
MIPITKVDVTDSEALVIEVLRSGNLAQGPMVKRLEDAFAEFNQVEHCIAVNNGTTALVAALQVSDLAPGQEVITSPFTFVATLNAIIEAGAVARFVDINESDFCIDPQAVTEAVNERTAIIMPVHLYGQSADMGSLSNLSEEHGFGIVEDAAQAHGARFDGQYVGSFGIGCFSLYATKNITSAEGGLITTNDAKVAERLRILRNQGMKERYQYVVAGHNYRMTDVHAAIAIPQISKISKIGEIRNVNAEFLSRHLSKIPGIKTPRVIPGRTHVWHQYTILIDPELEFDRDHVISLLNQAGVACGSYYPKLTFDYDCFRDHPNIRINDVSTARNVATRCISLPVHQYLSESDLEHIVSTFKKIFH